MEKGEVVINTAPYVPLLKTADEIAYIIDLSSERCIKKENIAPSVHLLYPGS